jgi:hypothetical protein
VADDDHANSGENTMTRIALIAVLLLATAPAFAAVAPAVGGIQAHPSSLQGGGG